jgi:hypothetical protein
MPNPNFDTILQHADFLLQSPATEPMRLEDDFAAYKACKSSKASIRKYLSSFLLKNHIEPEAPITLANLLEQCKAIDKKFEAIDMSCILCRHDLGFDNYCLSMEKVIPCMKVAEQTRDVVSG